MAFGEKLVEAREDVVAQHDGHFQTGREAHYFARAGYRVHTAGIGDDGDAALADAGSDTRDKRRKIAGITEVGIGLLLLLQDRHGDLG